MMSLKSQHGVATLIVTTILMVAITMVVLFTANYGSFGQQAAANQKRSAQAYAAAEAGLEFGIQYLAQNNNTITANKSNGYIQPYSDINTTNVPLANASRYSISYTNPIQNNYNIITVTSTGISDDGTSTEVISQQIQPTDAQLQYAATSKGGFFANGNVTIDGPHGLHAGLVPVTHGNVSISNINAPDPVLATQSNDALFQSIFGTDVQGMKNKSIVYNNSASVPWSTISGFVWVDSSGSLAGNQTIGSPTNPVLLIVNGNFSLHGNATMNGLLIVIGNYDAAGNVDMNGSVVATGSMTLSGNALSYNSDVVQQLLGINYVKIPGSWKDF